jgi:hypothetical protein
MEVVVADKSFDLGIWYLVVGTWSVCLGYRKHYTRTAKCQAPNTKYQITNCQSPLTSPISQAQSPLLLVLRLLNPMLSANPIFI